MAVARERMPESSLPGGSGARHRNHGAPRVPRAAVGRRRLWLTIKRRPDDNEGVGGPRSPHRIAMPPQTEKSTNRPSKLAGIIARRTERAGGYPQVGGAVRGAVRSDPAGW